MDRLISADALQKHFDDMQHYEECACNFESSGADCTEWYCVEQALENAPAVNAIPVDWLEERRQDMEDAEQDFPAQAIRYVLWLWGKYKEVEYARPEANTGVLQ